jgi:hypothetical protein
VIGIDPASGALKFHVPLPSRFAGNPTSHPGAYNLIIAGDGFAYVTYDDGWWSANPVPETNYRYGLLAVLRVSSSGASDDFMIRDWNRTANFETIGTNPNCHDFVWSPELEDWGCYPFQPMASSPAIITNADTGVLVAWHEWTGADWALTMANLTGSGVSVTNGPQVPHSSVNPFVTLQLQAQDGSFIGETADDTGTPYVFSFDAGGTLRWVVPNVWASMATADGGFIFGDTGSDQFFTIDQNGNVTGQVATLPTYSWMGNAYHIGSVEQVIVRAILIAGSWWATQGGNQSSNGAAINQQWFPELKSCRDNGGDCSLTGPLPRDLLFNAKNDLVNQLRNNTLCQQAAKTWVYDVVEKGLFPSPLDSQEFAAYLSKTWHFYDGTKSTLDVAELGSWAPANARTVAKRFFFPGSETTAATGTPSTPLKSFWQPADATNNAGVGIDPRAYGMNLQNESNLFHEALHGFVGKFDGAIQQDLHAKDPTVVIHGPSENISVYIQNHVLNACPIGRR